MNTNTQKFYAMFGCTTKDFPGEYVVREFLFSPVPLQSVPGKVIIKNKDFETVKNFMLEYGWRFTPREIADDPIFMGVWL